MKIYKKTESSRCITVNALYLHSVLLAKKKWSNTCYFEISMLYLSNCWKILKTEDYILSFLTKWSSMDICVYINVYPHTSICMHVCIKICIYSLTCKHSHILAEILLLGWIHVCQSVTKVADLRKKLFHIERKYEQN